MKSTPQALVLTPDWERLPESVDPRISRTLTVLEKADLVEMRQHLINPKWWFVRLKPVTTEEEQ